MQFLVVFCLYLWCNHFRMICVLVGVITRKENERNEKRMNLWAAITTLKDGNKKRGGGWNHHHNNHNTKKKEEFFFSFLSLLEWDVDLSVCKGGGGWWRSSDEFSHGQTFIADEGKPFLLCVLSYAPGSTWLSTHAMILLSLTLYPSVFSLFFFEHEKKKKKKLYLLCIV